MYTGRYREGVDDENYPKWKTNLRCAMNKAKDIKVIDEESRPEATEPFKIYKFVPQPSKCHLFLTRSVMFLQPCIKFCNCILHKLLRSRIQCFCFCYRERKQHSQETLCQGGKCEHISFHFNPCLAPLTGGRGGGDKKMHGDTIYLATCIL